MRYFITALTNDRARLIVSQTETNDAQIFEMVKANLEALGFIVVLKTEE